MASCLRAIFRRLRLGGARPSVSLRALRLLVLAPAVAALGAAPVRAAFGELTVLEGTAVVSRAAYEIRGEAGTRIRLEEGDRVRTLAASRVYIRMSGRLLGVEAVVAQQTALTLNERLAVRKAAPFVLESGALRARAARFFRWVPLVSTPAAAAMVAGTDFIVTAAPAGATVLIGIAGRVEAVARGDPTHRLRIGPRQWGRIVPGAAPGAPDRVPGARWAEALRRFAFPR